MLRACPHHRFSELTQIDTFYNDLNEQDQDSLNAAADGNILSKMTREAWKIIENKSKVEKTCVICGGAHAYYDCIATDSNQPSVCVATGTYNQVSPPNRTSNQIPPPGFAPVQNNQNRYSSEYIVPNPKGEMKAITTRSSLAYEGPSIPTNSPLDKVVERDTEETTDKEHSNCQGSIAHIQPPVVPILIPEPDVSKTQPKPNIYPSRLNDQKLREKATNQMETIKSVWVVINHMKASQEYESMNQNFFEPNLCYEPNSSSFDQYHSSQSSVTPQLPQRSNEDVRLEMAKLIKNNRILLNNNDFPHEEMKLLPQFLNDSRTIEQAANLAVQQEQEEQADFEEMLQDREKFIQDTQFFWKKEIPELMCKLLEDVRNIRVELAVYINSPSWNCPTFFFDNDEEDSILFIESSAKNLLPIPSEYEVTFDDENECDVPDKDESSLVFTTFSNPLFNDNDDFTSSDDESISDEDVPTEDFKVYSHPLFNDDEIISDEIDPHCFNAKSDLVKSLSNHDTLIDSSLKFDFLDKFFGTLLPTSIADEERIRREHAEYISFMERLFTINPCPRPMDNSNTIIKTLPLSTIPVEDSDSQREEIDIFIGTDELLPSDIESDDYDLEGDIYFLKELIVDDSIPILENKSSDFDHQDDPSFPHPPSKPPDVEISSNPIQDITTFDFFENPMMMYGGDILLLDVPYLHFYPP
nr:reverse transcriptase domain-containing protein [Tanacetum cinerariifolium]